MDDPAATRASLLLRIRDPHDGEAFIVQSVILALVWVAGYLRHSEVLQSFRGAASVPPPWRKERVPVTSGAGRQ